MLTQNMPLLVINEDSHDDTRETLRRHIATFAEDLGKQNEVGLIIDGKVKYLNPDEIQACELLTESDIHSWESKYNLTLSTPTPVVAPLSSILHISSKKLA